MAELRARGPEALHAELARAAPQAAAVIDPHDRHRIVRALELLDEGVAEPPGNRTGCGRPTRATRRGSSA